MKSTKDKSGKRNPKKEPKETAYTITLTLLRNEKPIERWIEIESIGTGKIVKTKKRPDGKWEVYVEFCTENWRDLILAMDDRFISTTNH